MQPSQQAFFVTSPNSTIVLASASPRRRELLSECGIVFTIRPSDIDETEIQGESPEAMVRRLAVGKAQKIADEMPEAWVLGADTTVVCQGEVFGKPASYTDALRMLSALQGSWHTVLGGVCLLNKHKQYSRCEVYSSRVRMRSLSSAEIQSYWNTGEPCDKAGSYAIQGVGASLVEEVQGSYTNVVGLNLAATMGLLLEVGAIHTV